MRIANRFVPMIVLVLCSLFDRPVVGALITVPTSLNVGDQYRLVFVTSGTRNARSTNIGDYNAFVTNAATSVSVLNALGTTWTAIASAGGVDARTNTSTDPTPAGNNGVPIFLLNDTRVADNYDDLWDGSLDARIRFTELEGDLVNGSVWTGTENSGLSHPGSLGTSFPIRGLTTGGLNDAAWVNFGSTNFNGQGQLYALSATLTVVPEPSPVTMLVVFAGLIGVQLKRRSLIVAILIAIATVSRAVLRVANEVP